MTLLERLDVARAGVRRGWTGDGNAVWSARRTSRAVADAAAALRGRACAWSRGFRQVRPCRLPSTKRSAPPTAADHAACCPARLTELTPLVRAELQPRGALAITLSDYRQLVDQADSVRAQIASFMCRLAYPAAASWRCARLSPAVNEFEDRRRRRPRSRYRSLLSGDQPAAGTGCRGAVRHVGEGLPLGVQIVGRRFHDADVLAVAALLEAAFGAWRPDQRECLRDRPGWGRDVRALAERLADLADQHDAWRGRSTLNLNAPTTSSVPRPDACCYAPGRQGHFRWTRSAPPHGWRVDRRDGRRLWSSSASQVVRCAAFRISARERQHCQCPGDRRADRPEDTLMVLGEASAGHQSYRRDGWGGRLARTVVDVPFDVDRLTSIRWRCGQAVEAHRPALIIVGTAMFIMPYDLDRSSMPPRRWGAGYVRRRSSAGIDCRRRWQNPLRRGRRPVDRLDPEESVWADRRADHDPLEALGTHACLTSARDSSRITRTIGCMALGVALAELAAFGADTRARVSPMPGAGACAGGRGGSSRLARSRGYTRSNQVLLRVAGAVSADALVERWEQANIVATAMALPRPASRYTAGQRYPPGCPGAHSVGHGRVGDGAGGSAVWRMPSGRVDSDGVNSRVAELVGDFPTGTTASSTPTPPR